MPHLQVVRRRRCVSPGARHEGRRRDRAHGQEHRAHLRRGEPRGYLRPALLRDRGAPAARSGHPGLPRRPARDGGGDARRAHQRAQGRQQEAQRGEDRLHRGGRERHRDGQAPHAGGRAAHHRVRPRRHALPGPDGEHELDEDLVRRPHEPRQPPRLGERRPGGRRRLHRSLRPRRGHGGRSRQDEPRADRLRHGQPDARDHARGGRALRPRHGHGAVGLPQPDQQLVRVPGHLPRPVRRARAPGERRDEARRRARPRRVSSRTASCPRSTSPRRCSTRAWCRRSPPPWPTRPCAREWPAASEAKSLGGGLRPLPMPPREIGLRRRSRRSNDP